MNYRIPLAYNSLGPKEIAAAESVLKSGYVTQGKCVAQFERELSEMHGVKHAILVNSGSSANLVGLEAVVQLSRLAPSTRIPTMTPGDEVIIQGLNWPSTLKPLVNMGLTPVFCDIDLDNLNASPIHVEAVRTEKTRMVVAVPVLGNPTYLEELEEYCSQQGLVLFVDGCESLGATSKSGRRVGNVGLATAFSFYFSHHITTIEGGVILTDDDHVADLCLALRAHGWSRNLRLSEFLDFDSSRVDPRFCFVLPGYNVRSTDVNAAIGTVQLQTLHASILRRQAVATARVRALHDGGNLIEVPGAGVGEGHSWMTLPMLFPSSESRDRGQAKLEAFGIETRPIIVGNMLRHPLARNLSLSPHQPELPNCDEVFDRGLMIGLDPDSSSEDESWVCHALSEVSRAI